MPSSKIERKLAAIMFTDIAGYTEQMSKDEAVAISLLDTKKKVFRPLLKKHNGKLVKEMGDGTLSHFPSAIDASNCSIELQKSLKKNTNINVRVGVHQGEVLFKDKDVYGDVVNIASRLETMSPAGGILVSKNVYDEISSRKGYDGVSLGLQSLKGIGRLIEIFGLKGDMLNEPSPKDYTDTKIETHSDKEVPSIAIIPFENKGKDEDVFYAYGISVDLISDVSSAGLIRVASKKQINDAGDLPQDELAKKLDVRYMANGELWRMGDMFQLSVELYDTTDKKVVWSDRWQEKWDNLPMIKGSLSDGLLKALDTTSKVEKKVETTNTEAYEFYLKAKHKYEKRENTDDTEIARGLLQKAIELDDNLILAKVILGTTYREMGDTDRAMEIYTSALTQAKKISDKVDIIIGIGIIYREKGDFDTALGYFERAFEQEEKLGNKSGIGAIHGNIGNVHANRGNNDTALDYYERSLAIFKELGDKYRIGGVFSNIGGVHWAQRDFDKALDYYEKSLKIREEIGDKHGIAISLGVIGLVYYSINDTYKALDYYERSLKIREELGDKRGMGYTLGNIGSVYSAKGDYDTALGYFERSLKIREELSDKHGLGYLYTNLGISCHSKGDYDNALDYYEKSLKILEEIGDKYAIGYNLTCIGTMYDDRGNYDKAIEYLEKSLIILKKLGLGEHKLHKTVANLYLTYKHLGKEYDEKEIHTLIKEAEDIDYNLNYALFELLEDTSYLETAYNQVQKKADNLEPDVAAKFLSYPIPKAIVEEWEKVK